MDESDVEVVHVVPSMLFPVSLNLSNFTLNALSFQRLEFDSRYGLLNLLYELLEGCQRFAGRNEDPWSPLSNVNISGIVRFPWKPFHLPKSCLRDEPAFVVKLASMLGTDYGPSNALRFIERVPSVGADVGKAAQLSALDSLEEEGFYSEIEWNSRPGFFYGVCESGWTTLGITFLWC